MKLLYGTGNPAKLAGMRQWLAGLDIELIGLNDLGLPLPAVDECGADPLENAVIKANTFYQAFHLPVFSCDSGLFFEGLDESLQLGTHVRRINGRTLSDEEMISYYAKLADSHGGQLLGWYQNAICLILDEQHQFQSMDQSLHYQPFLLLSQPHPKRKEGFPLDSLSADPKTGRYFFDMEDNSSSSESLEGFRDFFCTCLAQV